MNNSKNEWWIRYWITPSSLDKAVHLEVELEQNRPTAQSASDVQSLSVDFPVHNPSLQVPDVQFEFSVQLSPGYYDAPSLPPYNLKNPL